MSEPKIPPVPVPRKSKQRILAATEDAVAPQSEKPVVNLDTTADSLSRQSENVTPPQSDTPVPIPENISWSQGASEALVDSVHREEHHVDDSLYEKPCGSNDSGNDNLDSSQIYEEFSPGAPWQQELVAWLMAREFGSSLPLGARPLPQSTESPPPTDSLSFMTTTLAQRASMVLSRLNTASPSTRLLVDIGQPSSSLGVPNSAYSSLHKKKSNAVVAPLSPMNDLDRDFLSLFLLNTPQSDRQCSDSVLVNTSSSSDLPLAADSSSIEVSPLPDDAPDDEDRVCEEFPVVSLRKNQAILISVDRLDGSLRWITGSNDKGYRTLSGAPEIHHSQYIHRRILAIDLLRANVDLKSRHVVSLTTIPNNQYARESPFAYACSSVQSAVAMVTCIAKALDAYNNNILAAANIGTSNGVLCVGRVLYRQQSLQPWTQSYAIVTESRHFIVIRPKNSEDTSIARPVVDHSIDLRYIRDLRQESAPDADGSRLFYMRFGTSTTSCLYIRPVCACSSSVSCACSANGCEPCSAQFSAWQSVLESLTYDASSTSRCLAEQRMSESDLPAVVDRILSHLTLSCLTVEGLHRQAGRVRVSSDLLTLFRRDPWMVRFESTTKEGDILSAHDIVSTLKKFFQSLDCPLLLTGVDEEAERCLATAWIGAHYNRLGVETRLAEYRKAFGMLHPVARRTLQAMLLHLRTVAALEAQNRMNFLALAASWGPTLMCSQNSNESFENRRNESTLRLSDVLPHGKSIVAGAIGVIIDLLSEMDSICPLEAMSESVRRDAHVQDIAVRLHLQPQQHKQAGEITLQIEVDLNAIQKAKRQKQSEGACSFNARRRSSHAVHIAPRLTAFDLIKQLCSVDEGIAHSSNELIVWEYLAGGSLRRPLLPSTRLLDVCCSWATLEPEELRNDCRLVIEAAPVENEENSLYEMADSSGANQQLEAEAIVSFKTSIPCTYGGVWTVESFAEPSTKLKHWLYVNDTEVAVKSMKAAPSALIGASMGHDEPKGLVRSGSALSSTGRPGGSFRSFFSNALLHIHSHRLASNTRLKYSAPLTDIGGVYAYHRSSGLTAGTSGLVIASLKKSEDASLKLAFHVLHVLNEQVRDRLLSYFYFSLLAPESINKARGGEK